MKQKIYKKNIKKIVFMVIMILLSNAITYCIVSDRYRNDHVTDIHAMGSIKIEKNTEKQKNIDKFNEKNQYLYIKMKFMFNDK